MTQNNDTPPNPLTPTKTNPFDGMADQVTAGIPTASPDDFRTLDPAYTLGRQMLALDDLFTEALGKFHERKNKPHNSAYSFMLPVALRIQQNCLSTARTMSAIDYMEHLRALPHQKQREAPRTPLPPPPIMGKQTGFDDEQH